ncbi:MAG: ribosome assembly RNA-binding protein YhbY [Magnetococcales bacterium]|nr:ribosome assembly RNA-binding protein YhbY [Magnetococcales bacterium]
MLTLTSAQKKSLRSMAHHLKPVVLVGSSGIKEQVIAALDEALEDHELVKVRFQDHKEEKKALTAQLVEETKAGLAGIVGHVAILYRPRKEAKDRTIVLPGN